MIRSVLVSGLFLCIASVGASQRHADWRMAYAPSHRVIYVKQWTYTFPEFRATTWVIALRYPPELAWSRDAVGKAELLTSGGWKPFKEVIEGSKEKRRMLLIDYEQDDPALAVASPSGPRSRPRSIISSSLEAGPPRRLGR